MMYGSSFKKKSPNPTSWRTAPVGRYGQIVRDFDSNTLATMMGLDDILCHCHFAKSETAATTPSIEVEQEEHNDSSKPV